MHTNNTIKSNARVILSLLAIVSTLSSADVSAQSKIRFQADQPEEDGVTRGFTEPFRKIELSSDETGAISKLDVQVGDHVQSDQIVAGLDDRVQQLQVKMAKHLAASKGQLEAANSNLRKRQEIYDLILSLRKSGGTSNSELSRAVLELSVAKAKHIEALEEVVSRQLELQRAEIQLDRRWIRAPFSGVITRIYRQQGEFVSPVHPEIVTLAQIDKLIAVFNIPSNQIVEMESDRDFHVEFPDKYIAIGKLYSIGVETDAKSSTVELKIEIENSNGSLRSGEQCILVK